MRGVYCLLIGTCLLALSLGPAAAWHPSDLPPEDHPAPVARPPILFTSNEDLGVRVGFVCIPNYANGVTGGCGTQDDPWVVSGWLLVGALFSVGLAGISFTGTTDHVLVRDNLFILASGVESRGAENIRIEDNQFLFATALRVWDPLNDAPSKNIAFRNNVVDTQGQGNGIIIDGNTGTPIQNILIENNEITGTWNAAILAGRVSGLTITGNTITGNHDGIRCEAGNCGATITNNLIEDNTGAGIRATAASIHGSITHNIIAYNEEGFTGKLCKTGGGLAPFDHNNIHGNTKWGIQITGCVSDATQNWWGHASGPSGDGNGQGDAIFIGVSSTTWEPYRTSPNPNAGP